MTKVGGDTIYSRKKWQEATHFHPKSEKEVLHLISERVSSLKGAKKPLILLDLDSTLYEVGPRTSMIFKESLAHVNPIPEELRKAIENMAPQSVGYSIKDTLHNLGFPVMSAEMEKVAADIKAFWWDRFFSSDYLPHDRPYPGAVEYANHLHELGAELCYLTGRDEKRMRKGTEQNLIRDGFPFSGKPETLLMRQRADWTDAAHKTYEASQLANRGPLVASFENEPVNLVALSKVLPETAHVFVDTVCSETAAEPGKNLYYIKGFSPFRSEPR